MTIIRTTEKEGRRHNSTFAIGGVSSPLDSPDSYRDVVAESFVLWIKIGGKSTPIDNT